jgi:1-acyl-sn-glycerol-3-phosphate acyltransferase
VEPVYATTIGLGRLALAALDLRVDVDGLDRIPPRGPVVIAANHVSFLDFLLVGLVARHARRRVRFLCRYDVWRIRPVGAAMSAMRHVPVDPTAPAAAYLRARSLLRAGEAVGVFPEAGISGSLTVRPLMPGAAALAAATGAPLLPVALWGGQRIAGLHRPVELRRGRPATVAVGHPVDVPPDADLRAVTADLGHTLQRMLDAVQEQPRHRPAGPDPAPWHPAHLGGHAPTPEQARAVERVPRSAVPPTWAPGRPGRASA